VDQTGKLIKGGVLRQHASLLGWVQQLLDIAIVLGCLYGLTSTKLGGIPQPYLFLALITALLMLVVYQWSGTYHRLRVGGVLLEAQILFKSWGIVILVLGVLGFATKTNEIFSREVLLKWAVWGYGAQLLFHGLLRVALHGLRSRGFNTRHALLIGGGEPMRRFYERVAAHPWLGIKVVGYVDCSGPDGGSPQPEAAQTPSPIPMLGSLGDVAKVVHQLGVDLIYITLPISHIHQFEDVVRQTMVLNVDVNWVPDLSSFQLINHGVREIGGQPILCLSDSPLGGVRWLGKRLEDVVLATLILLIISPLLLAIAVGVKLSSPGPVLFKQKRGGLGYQEIFVWKFRTMKQHVEECGIVTQASRNDPRITRFGAFLRRTSLDELPQFINVLQGRMSVVGPRPHAVEHNNFYSERVDSYMLRHRIKPGITGWAQVNGWRGETDEIEKMEMRVKYDLYYINNWSIWFDLKIIFMTVFMMMTGKNAH
jgi:putative colanic acid biosynthesis UDP-glucose lipid carrier transferase